MDRSLIKQIQHIATINGHTPSGVRSAGSAYVHSDYKFIKCNVCHTHLYAFYGAVHGMLGNDQQALYENVLTPCGAVSTGPKWTNEILSELGYEISVREFLRVGIEKL